MRHIVVIPPQDEGYFVSREIGDTMFNKVNFNPYGPVVYATKLHNEEHEKVVVVDAQALNLNHQQTKALVENYKPDVVTYFLSAFSIPNDMKCVDWKQNKQFMVSPLKVSVDEVIHVYGEYPFRKEEFLTEPSLFTGKADFSLIDLSKYDVLRVNLNDFCPFKCRFCCRSEMPVKCKSVEETAEEIQYIRRRLGRREFFLFASEISLWKNQVYDLTEKLAGEKLRFTCMDRVDLVQEEFYEHLVKAGLTKVQLGCEFGTQKCLDYVGKGITPSQATATFNMLRQFKSLKREAFFIVGLPCEEWNDLWSTVTLAWTLHADQFIVEPFYPCPSSRLYREMKAHGELTTLRWEFYKHHKRRILPFHHPLFKNYEGLSKTKSLMSALMAVGTGKLNRLLARKIKNEMLSFVRLMS